MSFWFWSYTVSHFSYAPLFQGSHFWTKTLESNILYDNLLIDILSVWWHQKYRNRLCESFWATTSKAILTNMHVQPERLYFLFAFLARQYPLWSFRQKNTKNNYFILVKPLFSVVEFSITVTFWRNMYSFWRYIIVSYNNQTGFPCKLFYYESLVDKEVYMERSGSVVECLTRDRRAAGSSLTGVTALWSLSKTHLS